MAPLATQHTPKELIALVTLTEGGLARPMRVVNTLEPVSIGRQMFAPFLFSVPEEIIPSRRRYG